MHLLNNLYITTPESRLRPDNDTLRVELEEETCLRVPLHMSKPPSSCTAKTTAE